MKYHFRFPLFVCLLPACAVTAFAQLTSTGVTLAPNYDTFVPPATGSSYTDPAFGGTIKRVSNSLNTSNADRGGYLNWIENEYATMSPFNSDNSRFILVHQSYFGLYDGAGLYIHDLPMEINSSSEPRWSRKDNSTLYYHSGNQLKSYNISTGGINAVHTFGEYASISGNGEMDISLDGDHFVFVGDGRYIFEYEISTDKKFQAFDANGNRFDAVYITPNNNVTVTWLSSGASRFTGIELFDANMNFQRQVAHAGGHMDVTRELSGDEVLVWTNSNDPQPIPNCNNGIVKIHLADGAQTCLLQLDWSLAVHISGPDGNGSVYVDTEAPGNPESGAGTWVPYTNEILQVKLDGSGTARWAHHRSRPLSSYNWQPKLSVSRDGSRLLYASNFDLPSIQNYNSEYADTYLLTMGASSGADAPPPTSLSTPPASPTTTVTVTRYEQDSSAVTYSGTWYQNKGAFNSGSSAVLAADAGAQAKFAFTGTGVKWIGYRDAWSGMAAVYVDGAFKATVDTYSAGDQAKAVQYSIDNLSNGAHTLTIALTGQRNGSSRGAWIWVDAFDVTAAATISSATPPPGNAPPPAPPSSTPVRIEQNNSAIVYTGGSWFTNNGASNSGGSAVLAMDPNARATLTFSGTAVKWIGYRDEWSGIARVYVDGALQATVDTYLSPSKANTALYSTSGLARGNHTIAIEVTGSHSASSAANWVWVDGFDVTP